MKKTSILMLACVLIFSSCSKTIDSGIKPKDLPPGIAASTGKTQITSSIDNNISTASVNATTHVETVTYKNGMTAIVTPDKLHPGQYKIAATINKVTINLVGVISSLNGMQTISLQYNSKAFFVFQINSSGMVGGLTINNTYFSYLNFYSNPTPDQKQKYMACMADYFVGCGNSWVCSLMCNVSGVVSCALGWSIGCMAGYSAFTVPQQIQTAAFAWGGYQIPQPLAPWMTKAYANWITI